MVKWFRHNTVLKMMARTMLVITLFMALPSIIITGRSTPAHAAYCCRNCCNCLSSTTSADNSAWFADWLAINAHMYSRLLAHQNVWADTVYWQQHMLPAFMEMGNQLAAVGMQQVMTIGMFMDAKEQMETQRLLQTLQAKAHKDYHPSIGMCEFGSRIKSLAATERKGEVNALILSQRSINRYLGSANTSGSNGSDGDIVLRLNQFKQTYCNAADNQNSLSALCTGSTNKDRANKDIDYQRTIENPWTIDLDLTNGGTPSNGDEDVIAMENNLYGFDGFNKIIPEQLNSVNNATNITDAQNAYLDMRAVAAKTKVAENSFNALMALKSEGSAGSKAVLDAYMKELGVQDAEINKFLGENPSYYAQMEVLTKKAYQSPLFYTNLYDKPANIARKGVAIQAIGLIQKFDLLKSYLRTEASLSILLDLSIQEQQRQIQDNITALK